MKSSATTTALWDDGGWLKSFDDKRDDLGRFRHRKTGPGASISGELTPYGALGKFAHFKVLSIHARENVFIIPRAKICFELQKKLYFAHFPSPA